MFKRFCTFSTLVFALLASFVVSAQVLPRGPSVCLNGPLPPFQSGSTPSNPGRWSNPDRPGLSWDFTFNPDPNNSNNNTLTAFWYGFAPATIQGGVTAGDPIWYISNTVQYSPTSWQAALYRAVQVPNETPGGGTAAVAETVGHVAVSFVPGQPEHMAVSWKLASMNVPVTECIQRLGSDANPSRTVVQQVGPAYSGLWFPPLSAGWGYQALIDLRVGAGGAVEMRESNIVSIYDTNNQPVWLAADGLPNSAWSTTPPPLAVTELPLKYVRATYDVTAPVVTCVSNCTELVAATGAGIKKFWRSYNNPAAGTVGVDVNAQFGIRTVNFKRPPSASASSLFATEKLTQPSNIVASPTNCVPTDLNPTTCPVAVSWAVLTTGFYGSVSALPYMREIVTGAPSTETALPANSSGAIVMQLALGKRYQFFLRTSSGQIIAQSSEIRTLSPNVSDPAYDTLLPYLPAQQANYAGTGGGSGGTSGGQASYSIPIQMAPGRRGMQPSVSLNYSSRAGNGVAGMGWSISAASSLHRCPKTRDQDGVSSVVKFDGEDRLCLDGQRLIEVSGGYGINGTSYRTEHDGQAKVLQLGGNLISPDTYFVVYRSDGMRDYYGAVAAANDTSTRDASAQQLLSGNPIPLAWMLRESVDRSNNTVRYSYTPYGSGEFLLSQINYTGSIGAPGNRTVVFSYTPRPDIGSSGLGGFLTRQTQVLSKIETKTPDTSAPPVNVLVRRYDLQFGANPAVIGVSKNSGRAQLTQVTECAADKCFKPTLLNWLDTPSTAPNLVASAFVWPDGMPEPVLPDGSQTITDEVRPLGDIDGDGSVEITRLISTSTGSRNFVVSFNASRQVRGYFETAFTSSFASTPADLNNDGRNDVFGIAPGGTANSKRIEGAFWNGSTAACVNGVCPFDSTLLVTKQSGDLCSLAPLPPPSPLLGLELSVQFLDVNGDSLPDLVTASAGACGQNTRGIFIQLNTSTWNGAQSLSTFTLSFGPPIFIPLLGPNELLYRIIDLDGDGTPEILTTKQTTAGLGEPRDLSVYRLNKVTGTYSAAQILQPDLVTVNTDYFIWTDVNGDGLVDLLTPSLGTGGRWTLRLNRGGTFFLVNFDSASDAPLRAGLLQSGATNQPFSPFNLGLVRASDFNADGRSELTVPRDFAERVCGVGYGDLTNGKAEEKFYCVKHPRTRAEVMGNDYRPLDGAPGPIYVGPLLNGTIETLSRLDSSIYLFSVIKFEEQLDGSFTAREVALPDSIRGQSSSATQADFDLYGDGLRDLFDSEGCRNDLSRTVGSSQPGGTYCMSPVPPGTGISLAAIKVRGTLTVNNGAGARPGRAPNTPELLKSVSDAYGKSFEWVYDALSSSGARTTNLPLYRLPARDGVGTDAPYIDAKHFYFASSMQVVAEMLTRNGIGTGLNETQYGYEEAMYNQQGRGFQGFRKIISEDHTLDSSDLLPPLNGKFGLRKTTIFHQKFPLTGLVQCEATTKLGVPLNTCNEVVETPGVLISGSKNNYKCRIAGVSFATSGLCTTWANSLATYGFAFPNQSTGYQFDLTNHVLMRSTVKNIFVIDQYANVETETSSNTSVFADGKTETRSTTTNRTYVADAATWWVNKLVSQRTTADALTGTRALAADLNPARSSTMVYGYHPNRQVNCEAMIPGVSGVTDCVNAAMASGAAAEVGLVERRTITSGFDEFGNVTSVSTTARDEALSRALNSNYLDSGGYFPNKVKDALMAETTSIFDNRFGKPSSVTDPNGLASSTTFDGMGREIGMLFPGAPVPGLNETVLVDNQLAPPKLVAYESCTIVPCPLGTVLRVLSDQKGTPRQMAYLDALGRTLRSATAAFNQTDARGTVLSWNTVDTQYSPRGLSYRSIEPRQLANASVASTSLISGGILTTMKYDQLGRPLNKVSMRVARNNSGGYGAGLQYRTQYTHAGFSTSIRVCGLALNEGTCPAGGNPYGYVLDMTREFDESGAVIHSTDANNGLTSFYYDAAHSPVKLVDAGGMDAAQTTAKYNDVGHRTEVHDPNRGIWTYQYNGFGELKQQTDARALTLTQNFDRLGRMTKRSWMQPDRFTGANGAAPNVSDTFTYNNDLLGQYGTLTSTERLGIGMAVAEGSVKENYFYDAPNRPTRKNYVGTGVAGRAWNLTEITRYDPNFGRPVRKNFPAASGILAQGVYYGYTLGGNPMQTGYELNYLPSDPRSSNATRYLRRDEGANARGQMLSSRFGSGDASQAYQWLASEYDASTGWLLSRCSGLTVCSGVAQLGPGTDGAATMKLGYEYDYFGNVSKSVNVGKRPINISNDVRQETFGYDPLHRMASASRAGPGVTAPQVTYSYSPVGNLWAKSDFGTDYLYNDPAHKHAVKQVTLAGGAGTMHYNYDANGNVITRTRKSNIESFGYDIDNRPQWTNTITHTGSTARIDFYLSATGAKALQVAGGAQPRVVIYAGAYEAEYTGPTLTASRTYLAEGVLHNGAGTPVEQGGQMGLSFMHQDRLGSALVISDKGGGILGSDNGHAEFRTFDAFGKARDNQGLDNLGGRLFANNPNGKRNRKGFTGHEHLDEAGLIHMNGRTYDYNLGRFYGVDPVIQFPTNSQSLNGYSYLMNNPLSGTDPTGYKTCDVSQATSCLEEGANQIMDGDKDLGVINLTDSGKDTYSAGVNLTAAGHEYVAARTLANGGSNLQSAAGGQDQKPGADKVGESTKRPNSTVGDEVYQNRGIQLVGMDSTGRNLGNEVGVALATAIPCTLSGPGMLACMAGGSVLLEDGPNSPGFEVGVNLMAPSAGAVLERAVVALVGKAASALGRAAVEAAERIKVPTAPVPEAMQAPVSMQQLKYHYTTSPDSAFADGFRAHSSVTDRANLLPYEAHQTLGIPIPTRVIPIIDRGTFGPKSDVLDTDTYFGGGTQYFNSNRIPPGDILPGFDLPK